LRETGDPPIAGCVAATLPAYGEDVLRIAMTASDIPTTAELPNNGFEGLRFLGYPVFEGLVLWDLYRADRLAGLNPGPAESWEQVANDKKTWIFHLRHGVKFHDGTEFNADAVIGISTASSRTTVPGSSRRAPAC
jgi:peptide/nickel transport system substrate-binding protein